MPSGSFHGNLGGTSFCHLLWCAASLSPCGRLWYMPADASLHLLNKPLAKTWKSKGRFGLQKHATFGWKVAELRCVNDRLMIWNLYAWFWLQFFFSRLSLWMFFKHNRVFSLWFFAANGGRRCCCLSVTPKSVIGLHVALSILCIPVFSQSFISIGARR